MSELTIGQLSKKAGIGVETVRFYQRRGLLLQPERPSTGYRRYSEEAIQRIQFIRQAQDLGFSLHEIADLLSLRVDSSKSCAEVRRHTQAKLHEVDRKIASLQRIKRALGRLARSCSGQGPTSECPILDALAREKNR